MTISFRHGLAAAVLPCLAALASSAGAYELAPWRLVDSQPDAGAVAVADIDGDGRNDLVVAIHAFEGTKLSGHVLVYLQGRDGTLRPPLAFDYAPTTHNTLALAVGDITGDGRPDIVVGHDRGFTMFFNRGFESAHRRPLQRSIIGLGWGQAVLLKLHDVDGNGALDLVTGPSSGVDVYLNDGTGSEWDVVRLDNDGSSYADLDFGDVNGDGFVDLVATVATGEVRVHLHDGWSGFAFGHETIDTGHQFLDSAAVGDLDGDGLDDLAIAVRDRIAAPILLSRQEDGGLLDPEPVAAYAWPGPMLARDMDGDGRTDLVVLHNGESAPLGVFLQADGGLAAEDVHPTPYATWNPPQALAAGDLNGDGCLDVVVANYIEGPVVFDGMDCHPHPDVVPHIGLSGSVLRLAARNEGNASAPAVVLETRLDLRSGGLVLGGMPDGCMVLEASGQAARVSCTASAVAAGSEAAFDLAVLNDRSRPGYLKVDAMVEPVQGEVITRNNRTSRQVALQPRKAGVVVRSGR